ncbi:hypothetical protein Enr10x_19620 [Gimesia panareensis]|uniref:DUF3592 domain-containing protein n=1 Tax=Gimesia panareensis TaxID=2527978 RepID=A0A517Q4Y7_9PLAN|nr:DUF3592 domain-containing protein [Gimesia panareensis]QDT26652.1 hypothetical protein Enr10x_19620 [Gimesia panareensis]
MVEFNSLSGNNNISEAEMFQPRNFFLGLGAGVVLISVASYMLFVVALPDVLTYWKFRSAVATPVTRVLNVRFVFIGDEESTGKVFAKYEYVFNGKTYTGRRPSVYSSKHCSISYHQYLYDIIKSFQDKRGALVCYVIPENPAESVIDNTFQLDKFFVPFLFVLIPGGMGTYILITTLLNTTRYFESKYDMPAINETDL